MWSRMLYEHTLYSLQSPPETGVLFLLSHQWITMETQSFGMFTLKALDHGSLGIFT